MVVMVSPGIPCAYGLFRCNGYSVAMECILFNEVTRELVLVMIE